MKSTRRDRIKTIVLDQLAILSLQLVIVIILSLAAIITFYKLSSLLLEQEIAQFDDAAYQYIRNLASPFVDSFMLTVTSLGNRQFVIFPALGLMAFYLFIKPHRWYAIKIPAVAVGSITANLILKALYDRARPTVFQMIEASGLSFPSGHAMFNLSFYGLLIYIVQKEVGNKFIRHGLSIVLFLLIISIGVSRVYLGVHYASDVLAGFSAGFLWLVIALYVTGNIEKRVKKRQQELAKSGDKNE